MMPIIDGFVLAVSSSLPASIVAKATVAAALALIAARLARHSRAAVRHALLATSFGMMAALPVAPRSSQLSQCGISHNEG